jgi:hypothetical protein
MKRITNFAGRALPAIALMMIAGCSTVSVEVNAYRSELPFPPPDSKIYVEAAAADEPALLGRELRQSVVRELESRGYTCVDDPDDAASIFSCVIGIDQGHTVVDAAPRTDTFYGTSAVYGRHGFVGFGYGWGAGTTYVPESYREFDRRLMVTLADAKKLNDLPEVDRNQAIIWQATAISTGTSRDLRRIMRYLLAAVFDYFGRDTQQAVHETFSKDDKSVQRFAPP